MRFAIALGLLLLFAVHPADARPRPSPKKTQPVKRDRVTKKPRRDVAVQEARDDRDEDVVIDRDEERSDRDNRGAQSVGLPWAGRLQNPTRLRLGDGAYIRHPYRAFGTRTTVEFTKQAIEETIATHPSAHVLAVGDLSQERGGAVSDHHSHQSGRDVDLGFYYKKKPPGYPNAFPDGTEANLDSPTMWTLISKLAGTSNKDGGVSMIFLDYEVQGVIYRWAKAHGVSEPKLERIFQYPRGREASGIVRHYRNHTFHLHARFKCAGADTNCH